MLSILALCIHAQQDTLYIMKNGKVINKQAANSKDVDSIIFYSPQSTKGKSSPNDTMYFMKNGMVINQQAIKSNDVDSAIFYAISGTFIDSRDSNTYKWIRIGNQIWMAENLRYLPNVVAPKVGSKKLPYYYVYGNDSNSVTVAKNTINYQTYGAMYNWRSAIMACPVGWHLPSYSEFMQLIMSTGSLDSAGGNLKETGTNYWKSPNTGATNKYGFTALPGGSREPVLSSGAFYNIHLSSAWWSSTNYDENIYYIIKMKNNESKIEMGYTTSDRANYCRCVKD